MKKSANSLEFKFERTIAAPAAEVYDAWLNPKIPGNLWNFADKLLLNPSVDGFFYVLTGDIPHYGRFTKTDRPKKIQHTFVSPNTLGQESIVTVSFDTHNDITHMKLVHSGLPNHELAMKLQDGWNYFFDVFANYFETIARKKK